MSPSLSKRLCTLVFFCFLLCQQVFSQTKVITGKVSDETGNPVADVSVLMKNTKKGTVTAKDGSFSIVVPAVAKSITISHLGFVSQEINISVVSEVSIKLIAESGSLADVVVVGYGTQRKRDVTGSISTIKGDDFKNLPIANAASALQGRASGVDIVSGDGAPGNSPSIRIRGTGTINGSDPLIVIDGVPGGSLSDVNPNNIASIEVLKDASASAIYGSRAANGVVLVTTKKGNYGEQAQTSVNVYRGTVNVLKKLNLLTAPDLVKLKQETLNNDGSGLGIWSDPYYATQRTDWQKELFGTGNTTNADLAIRGGSAKSKYSITGNYFDDKGMILNSYFKRASTSFNSEHKVTSGIRVGENFLYSVTSGNTPNTRSAQDGLIWSALRFNPAIPVRTANGGWGASKASNELGDINNPIFTTAIVDSKNTNRHILANAYVEVDLLKGLMLKANYGLDQYTSDGYSFNIATPDQTRVTSQASLNQGHSEGISWLQEIFLTYNTEIRKNHNITLTGGYSAQTFQGNSFGASRIGYTDDATDHRILDNGNAANQRSGGSGSFNHSSGLQSYFVRGNYSFMGKYLLTATMRADGSSKFLPSKQWGYFPAFSAGWRISDEKFFKDNVSFLNTLKLTGGWGRLGNQSVADFQYLGIISGGSGYNFGSPSAPIDGSSIISLSNPNITWEKAEMTNIALEFSLLNSHLSGTVAWFNKDTKDMLIPYSLVENFGNGVRIPDQNIGTLNNHGIEVDLNYQNKVGNLSYNIGANASFIKNKVTLLYGTKDDYIGSSFYGRESLETSRTYEGLPIGSFFGFKTGGLYQTQAEIDSDPNRAHDDKSNIKPGDVKFLDQNGDGVIDDKDRVNLGNPHPSMVLGLNTSLHYKSFDMSLAFSGAFGFKLYNADRMAGLDASQVFNWYAEQNSRWHGAGTSNSIPRLSRANTNQNYRSSDLWIEKGDYLALKNISIGYTISTWKIGGAKMPVTRLYASCYNAFYLTGYRGFTPELGYTDGNKQRGVDVAQYPAVRTITIGATLNL